MDAIVPNLTPRDIEWIVELFKAGTWNELELHYGEIDLFLSKRAEDRPSWASEAPSSRALVTSVAPPTAPAAPITPVPNGQAPAAAGARTAPQLPEGHIVVEAPSLGSFYRAAKPGVPPFVEIGAKVLADSELCLIEVMKLFTTLRAGVDGTVKQILVADGAMIERGQPLFVIDTHD
jgi:acetyl-CoA carboxylase biotin carboxyl carrier protein